MTTTQLNHPVTTRPGLARPGAGRAPTRPADPARPGLAPPGATPTGTTTLTGTTRAGAQPPATLGSRWRGAWLRLQRFVLSAADDCPAMLLPIARRN
jgi:hypothetical protein